MTDRVFGIEDLDADGFLAVDGVPVGGFAIEDSSGQLVFCPQHRSSSGAVADLSMYEISGNWKVRYFHGVDGTNTSGGINRNEAIIYALIFG